MQWRGRWAQDDTQRKVVCRNFGGERGGASLLVLVIIPKLQRDWEKIQAGKELKSVILPQPWQRNSPFPGGAAGQNAPPKHSWRVVEQAARARSKKTPSW